ncbi:ROK family protein [Wenjunlia vitaminophila]|uniref:ROK family protein n=1 Tax=Wenjunlia vitaminophila TaxID=76728 RepID=A0A0T6LWP3_WENVI|nr:ROK family protein [Wenjunlia vitaminophila]KRV50417.1 ROK family protein [Wenjunlia vitaminophila]
MAENTRVPAERADRSGHAVLGLDIGGTKLAAGVVGRNGQVHSFLVTPTLVRQGVSAVLDRLFALGRRAIEESGVAPERIGAVGIGCGGPLDCSAGVLLGPPHLPGWWEVPVVRLAEREYGLPTVLENDATAAAAGEHRFGAGRGTRHMIYLTISTGVGGGVVIDGRVYRGAAGNGGELGHVTVERDGRPCRSCGRRGCLEAYASGTSIAERAQEAVAEALAAGRATALARYSPLTARDVAREAAAGDGVAGEVWAATTDALACGVTSLVNLFEPELVVLGGGVTRAGERLLAPVRRTVREQAMGPAAAAASVVAAHTGDHVGVVGAAAVAFERAPVGPHPTAAPVPPAAPTPEPSEGNPTHG